MGKFSIENKQAKEDGGRCEKLSEAHEIENCLLFRFPNAVMKKKLIK